jgi:DNA-binding response OmpR family regulator
MIYDTKNRFLFRGMKAIRLSKLERKLIILLSSKKLSTYEEMAKYLYDSDFQTKEMSIRTLIKRFKEKTKLNVVARHGRGYILKDDIYFK